MARTRRPAGTPQRSTARQARPRTHPFSPTEVDDERTLPPSADVSPAHLQAGPTDAANEQEISRVLRRYPLPPADQASLSYELRETLQHVMAPRPGQLAPSSGHRRSRRPSISPVDSRAWGDLLGIVNEYRKKLLPYLSNASGLGEGLAATDLPTLDALLYTCLSAWAKTQERESWMRAPDDEGQRFLWWWERLIGALEAYRVAYATPSSDHELSDAILQHGREPADQFIGWCLRPDVQPTFGERTRGAVVSTMMLFDRTPGARERIRRCHWTSCGKFFLDESPTYRRSPAKWCSDSHRAMASKERAKSTEPN